MSRELAIRVCKVVFVFGVVNFFCFMAVALYAGGDAWNGRQEAGRFYLGSHGRYTEVSRNVFLYSRLHSSSLWLTHPAAIIAAIVAQRLKQKS